MNKWYKISINRLVEAVRNHDSNDQESLEQAFDLKYGNYDYSEDLRNLNLSEFENYLETELSKTIFPNIKTVIITGVNSGFEIKYIGSREIVGVDISTVALKHLKEKYPYVDTLKANMTNLPFLDNSFDAYLCFRAIQSRGIDIEIALREAIRITKNNGKFIISIPNGYLEDGQIIKGLWSSRRNIIDIRKPYELIKQINEYLNENKCKDIMVTEITSEIFISCIIQK